VQLQEWQINSDENGISIHQTPLFFLSKVSIMIIKHFPNSFLNSTQGKGRREMGRKKEYILVQDPIPKGNNDEEGRNQPQHYSGSTIYE
jgi:hypothetical protein